MRRSPPLRAEPMSALTATEALDQREARGGATWWLAMLALGFGLLAYAETQFQLTAMKHDVDAAPRPAPSSSEIRLARLTPPSDYDVD